MELHSIPETYLVLCRLLHSCPCFPCFQLFNSLSSALGVPEIIFLLEIVKNIRGSTQHGFENTLWTYKLLNIWTIEHINYLLVWGCCSFCCRWSLLPKYHIGYWGLSVHITYLRGTDLQLFMKRDERTQH